MNPRTRGLLHRMGSRPVEEPERPSGVIDTLGHSNGLSTARIGVHSFTTPSLAVSRKVCTSGDFWWRLLGASGDACLCIAKEETLLPEYGLLCY